MALTIFQQYAADKAQTQSPDECCLALGGDLVIDSDGTELCSFQDYEYPRSQACMYAAQIAGNSPDANTQQSGGGIGAWLSTNAENVASILGNIGTLLTGGTQTPTQQGPMTNDDDDTDNTLLYVIIGLVVVVVAFVLIRKSRK